MFISPMSALQRIADSRRASRKVRKSAQKLTSVLWHRRATRYPIPSRPFASKQSIEPKGIAHAKNVGRSVVI
jgi:hypothetical protein